MSAWRPIETAPKDGARVLCFAPAIHGYRAHMRTDAYEDGWWNCPRAHPYTHWQPLPEPPEDFR